MVVVVVACAVEETDGGGELEGKAKVELMLTSI
jgi:hypothetical protein